MSHQSEHMDMVFPMQDGWFGDPFWAYSCSCGHWVDGFENRDNAEAAADRHRFPVEGTTK